MKVNLPVLNMELRAVLKSLAADIASGVLDGTRIANLNADNINAGTINAEIIDVININADNINAGTITGITIIAKNNNTGSNVLIDSSGGGVIFKYNNSSVGGVSSDATNSMIYSAIGAHLFFGNSIYLGQIDSNGITLPAGKSLNFASGRSLIDNSSELQVDGSFRIQGVCYPRYDNTDYNELGSASKRWKTLYSKNLNTGDIIFTDRYCPICEKEFEEGDCLVNFVYKKDSSGVSPVIYTVPAHHGCVKDYKKQNHQRHHDNIKLWDKEHNAKVKVAEKEFDAEEERKAVKFKDKHQNKNPEFIKRLEKLKKTENLQLQDNAS